MSLMLLPMLLLSFVPLPASIVGAFINLKKMTSLVGAISHSSIAGVGLVVFLNYYFHLNLNLISGSLLSSLLFVLVVFSIGKNSESSSLNFLWALGFSVGVIFLYKTPVYFDMESYILGSSALFVSKSGLILVFALSLVIFVFSVFFYYRIIFFIFDPEFLKFKGINTDFINLLFLILCALVSVILVFFTGIILTLTLLTLPYMASNLIFKNLKYIIISSFFLSMFSNLIGTLLSYYINLPPSVVISIFLSTIYALLFFSKKIIALNLS